MGSIWESAGVVEVLGTPAIICVQSVAVELGPVRTNRLPLGGEPVVLGAGDSELFFCGFVALMAIDALKSFEWRI